MILRTGAALAAVSFLGFTTVPNNLLASTFGYDGSSGANGRNGRNGASGQAVTIQADGSPSTWNTSGQDGTRGEDGWPGGDATSCRHNNPPYNLQGASGGNGGNGGQGGIGGDAGDIRVYYAETADLKRITVHAAGGRGAPGGWGGNGGDGCYCNARSWTIDDQTYYCEDGPDGSRGQQGATGRDGYRGQAYVIPRIEPLPPTTPVARMQLGALLDQPAGISREIWQQQSGAAALFAPGSRLADTWHQFVRVQESTVTLDWQAGRAPTDFLTTPVTLNFGAELPQAVFDASTSWLISESTHEGDNLQIAVTNAMLKSEAVKLRWDGLQGRDRNLVLKVADLSGSPDGLVTGWHIHYYTRGVLFWKLRFDGDIPADLVTVDGEQVALAIGRLNIHSSYLTGGSQVRIVLTAKRTFGPHQASVEWDQSTRIP